MQTQIVGIKDAYSDIMRIFGIQLCYPTLTVDVSTFGAPRISTTENRQSAVVSIPSVEINDSTFRTCGSFSVGTPWSFTSRGESRGLSAPLGVFLGSGGVCLFIIFNLGSSFGHLAATVEARLLTK